ncbi:MAG TPA: ABC transporter substrate-binding protein [Actinomycetota bacterium]|nr:ABC transporter substrate-binding protein [Actinomycetota bacterium]
MNARRARLMPLLVLLAILAAACSSGKAASPAGPVTLRLGYLPNLTQASAVVGVQEGIFARSLGSGVDFKPSTFRAGPDGVTALLSGALDAAYIGPNPAANAFLTSNGAIRIISGATSGGAYLMTKYAIKSAADLKGQKVASPEVGNTQDVALRSWLKSQGLNPSPGGDVTVVPQSNATSLQQFQQNLIAGAWVPEPWASRLQVEGGAKVLVDESTLWPPDGRYATTVLVVRTDYAKAHRDVVTNLLVGQVAANDAVKAKSAQAQNDAAAAIKALTGQTLSQAVSDLSWIHLTFTNDPIASSIATDATRGQQLGLSKSANISGIYDLTELNSILKAANEPQVSAG